MVAVACFLPGRAKDLSALHVHTNYIHEKVIVKGVSENGKISYITALVRRVDPCALEFGGRFIFHKHGVKPGFPLHQGSYTMDGNTKTYV